MAWGPEPVEPSLFLRPEVAAWEPLGPALKVAWGQQVKKAHPEALGVLGVQEFLQSSEDKISKIESGQTICRKGYSQKALFPESPEGVFPLPAGHGSLPAGLGIAWQACGADPFPDGSLPLRLSPGKHEPVIRISK